MTENGILIPKERVEKAARYTLLHIDPSMNEDILLDYRELMEESKAQIIKKTIELFETTWSDLVVEKVVYLQKENELHIILKNGIRVLFTLQDFTKKTGEAPSYKHLRMQLMSLKVFIEKYSTSVIEGKYIYIDARISGKIFSCSDKDICTKNIALIYPDLFP
jgi:hypothetical protein